MLSATLLTLGSLCIGFWVGKVTSNRSEILTNPAPAGSSNSRDIDISVAKEGHEGTS